MRRDSALQIILQDHIALQFTIPSLKLNLVVPTPFITGAAGTRLLSAISASLQAKPKRTYTCVAAQSIDGSSFHHFSASNPLPYRLRNIVPPASGQGAMQTAYFRCGGHHHLPGLHALPSWALQSPLAASRSCPCVTFSNSSCSLRMGFFSSGVPAGVLSSAR